MHTAHCTNRAQFLQLANGEWCHWLADIVAFYCVVGGRHGFGECNATQFHLLFLDVCTYVFAYFWAFDCLCNLNHLLFVERMPNEWNRWHKNTNCANHVVKVKCGEQKQWANMHYRSHICERYHNRKSVKNIMVICNTNANACARCRCCACRIFSVRNSSTNLNGEFITLDAHGAHYSC